MGIPYSREINAAFEQVTPLVAAGYKLLQTMRNISILLAVIQVLTVFLLVLVLGVGLLLVYSVNPDLEVYSLFLSSPTATKYVYAYDSAHAPNHTNTNLRINSKSASSSSRRFSAGSRTSPCGALCVLRLVRFWALARRWRLVGGSFLGWEAWSARGMRMRRGLWRG